MNARNIFISLVLLVGLIVLISPAMFAQTRYLNSTDGDDAYDGTSPTHDSPTIGPKRTLTGSFTAFASGTVVNMTAGSYIYNQSGIGGGNDAAGYTLGTGANKSMTFVVTTYLSNNVALLSTGGLTIDCGTGTITFQAQTAGTQSVSLSPTAPTSTIWLKTGTLDVSAITFNIGANAGTTIANPVRRTDGSVTGSLVYASAPCLLYDGSAAKNASGEVPATVKAITISSTAAGVVTFPNAITFGTTLFGLTNTTTFSSATFSSLVTLTSAVTTVTSTIVNSQNTANATFTFNGGITVTSTVAANGTVIDNQGSGKILVPGALTFTQADVATTNNGNNASTVRNSAGGNLGLTGGVIETPTAFGGSSNFTVSAKVSVVNFINNAAGTASVGGGASTTITGTFTTAAAGGTVTLTGPVTVTGNFTNGAGHTVALGTNNLTLNGAPSTVANSGIISSSAVGSGYVIFAHTTAGITDASGGVWSNIRKTSGQTLTLTTSATLNGSVETTGAGLLTLTGPTSIVGNVSIGGDGGITLMTGGTISGNISVGPGTGVLTTAANTVSGTTTLSSGGIILGGNVTLMGAYSQSGGNLNFVTFILDIKNNFTRSAGTVTQGTGTLQFSAGGPQTFSGGSNLEVYNFSVNGVGTGVTFVNGSLMVDNNATIVSNTNVILGDLNIRMQGIGTATPTFSNAGQYTSTGGGGIIFEGPGGGNQYTITGNGVNSNIEIRLAVETATVRVQAGDIVTWSGLLTLTRGTIDAFGAGSQFNPSTLLTTPTIQRNLGDQNTNGIADGYPIALTGGTFNSTNVNYNLTYYNLAAMVPAGSPVGPEFKVGASPRVVNLTINATGAPVLLPVAGLYKFSGNLKIVNSAELRLQGALGVDDLVSTGSTVNDTINGLLSRTGTATFSLVGDGNIIGGTKGVTTTIPTAADASTIADLQVNTVTTTATYTINNLKVIGVAGTDGITVAAGTVNLGMQTYGAGPTIGSVLNINVSAGTLKLTANATLLTGLNLSGGTFDFGNVNLYASNSGVTTVTATGGAFAATFATTGGYLVYAASGNLTTGTILVPRIKIAGAFTLTLTGNSGVSDIFQDYSDATTPVAGTLTQGANTFVIAGGTWNAMGTYTAAAGKIQITGATNVNLGAPITISNLEVKNTTNTATLVDNDGVAGTVPNLTVRTLFTMTSGKINLQMSDLILSGTGADALSYAGGTIAATTGTAVPLTDITYGEVKFNGAVSSLSAVAGLVIPNLTLNSTTSFTLTTNTVPITVSKYFVMNTPSQIYTTAGNLVIGDSAWIEVKSAGTLDKAPAFGNHVNYAYNQGANFTTGLELTASATQIQKFYNTPGAFTTTLNAAATVNNELRLINGDLKTTATKTLTMGANALVTRIDGTINVSATASANVLGGPISLTYLNTLAATTQDGEFPSTMTVNTLSVKTNIAVPTTLGAAAPLVLHASRTVKDFVLETDQTAAPGTPQNGTQFDLNGFTLTVSNVPTATLTRGALVSYKVTGGVYVYGTLAVAGTLTQTSAASIKNVIVTTGTATLAGTFGTQDYDGGGVNVLPGALPTMTVAGVASVAGFNGDLTVGGNTTINGAYTGGTLTVGGNVTVATGGSMNTATNLVFIGPSAAVLTVPSGGATVGSITFNKTTGKIDSITLAGGSLAATGTVNFMSGLFIVTDPLIFNIPAPLLGGGQGFTRAVAATDLSHVVGFVAKTLRNFGTVATATEAISVFPVGTASIYRPATLTFAPAFGVPTVPNATIVVSHVALNPGGSQGLPIKDGVEPGVDVSRYSSFYSKIFTIGNVDQNAIFDLALTAGNFSDFDSPANVRIIRRHGAVGDINNDWLLQGLPSGYDNEVNTATGFTAINKNSQGGLRTGGAIFTYGMKTRILVPVPLADVTISKAGGSVYVPNPYKLALSGKFTNGVGTFTYIATSTNTSVAKDTVVNDTLKVTVFKDGSALITVKATDANNDFATASFTITVQSTGVDVVELPTVFSLSQNYPNPFNPTTNIKFGIPQNSSVKITIYDMLGREVATLVNTNYTPGYYTVPFNASKLASGMYIYRMTSQSLSGDQQIFTSTKKLMLLK